MRGNGLAIAGLFIVPAVAAAHGVGGRDAAFVAQNMGSQIGPFLYLGAKHMVTGYDHLLFIFATLFFLYRLRQVVLYVTLFSLGHSITLLAGVLGGIHTNPYLIDAIIAFSVVFKAFDNLGGFRVMGFEPDHRLAVLVFGLFHGIGLATQLQDLRPSRDGLLVNMVSFNAGVEIGQLLALLVMLGIIVSWRRTTGFSRHAVAANAAIMTAGFVLLSYQLAGFFLLGAAAR